MNDECNETAAESKRMCDQAILLIWAAENVLTKRRFYEISCGYPDDAWGDKLLHQRLKEFLASPLVDPRLKELLGKFEGTSEPGD